MAAATIVHDTSEAVELCSLYGLYLKPITKMTISVALPQLKQPGKSISNWEVMERLKGMVQSHQFSTLRISKSTMDFIRFEGEVENKSLVKSFLACLDGKTIKLSGFSDILKVRAAEFKIDFPTRHDWDSFFRDAKDMNETLPGERPDTIHLEGLPCKWFALKESGSEKPNEEVLVKVFETFGEIRNVDIPMLDPYREEMTGRNFHTFSFGGHLNFEAYVQYKEYVGFIKAMNALRGMKLMYKGEDGKAVACNIKVSFDSTKHLSDASIKKRQLERQKLQELEQQREEQKRKEKEAEERQKEEEREGKNQYMRTFGIPSDDLFEAIYRSEEELIKFMHGLHEIWSINGRYVITAFDLSSFPLIYDLGGCSGALAKECITIYPECQVTIFEKEEVVQVAKKHFSFLENPRIRFHIGDFFRDPIPEADLYILARILHDWADNKCIQLLKNIHHACRPGCGVLVVETLLAEDKRGPLTSQLYSLNMLVQTEGKERTPTEYHKILTQMQKHKMRE
ncbi:A-kinase anchor protein 17A isoform 3-T3 [Sarcophilus harrisii]